MRTLPTDVTPTYQGKQVSPALLGVRLKQSAALSGNVESSETLGKADSTSAIMRRVNAAMPTAKPTVFPCGDDLSWSLVKDVVDDIREKSKNPERAIKRELDRKSQEASDSYESSPQEFQKATEEQPEKVLPRPLQELRDEARLMAANGRPKVSIPLYRGKKVDGDPVQFLRNHYGEYVPDGARHSLFLHELKAIDGSLAQSVINACRGGRMPIGTVSDLINALEAKYFFDVSPEQSERRVREARRQKTPKNRDKA